MTRRFRPSFAYFLVTLATIGPAAVVASSPAMAESGHALERAESHRGRFEVDAAIGAYEVATREAETPEPVRRFAEYLLALGRFDQAASVLERGVAAFPGSGQLLEQLAVVAAVTGRDDEAVAFLQRSIETGRPGLAWLEQPRLRARALEAPYRGLLDGASLLADFGDVEPSGQRDRLEILRHLATPAQVPALVEPLLATGDRELARRGVSVLLGLGSEGRDGVRTLLDAEAPWVRHEALQGLWPALGPQDRRALESRVAAERDPANADLAAVLLALLDAGESTAGVDRLLEVPETSSYRSLALEAAAGRLAAEGRTVEAEALRDEVRRHPDPVRSPEGVGLEAYWLCRDRQDLREARDLLEHHRMVGRVDARLYGLPRDDFDDQKSLSLAERRFLRAQAAALGVELPTSGPIQYPREIRHALRRLEEESGRRIDCAGRLAALPSSPAGRTLARDGGEVKLEEDSSVDNEVNIVVNPYDPRYLVATSNDYDGIEGNESYRSSDWGKTWTAGDVPLPDNCCDPVSFYHRLEDDTEVLYHSALRFTGFFSTSTRFAWSTDQGASWADCGTDIGTPARDRQDHVIDDDPASACYHTIYVGHHNGEQFVASSTATSFPYCQSFREEGTGVGGTLGSAMVVSTNGIAHDFFTQYASPGGVWHTSTADCGASWSSSTRILSSTNAGDFEWGVPSTCMRQVYRYPQADTDRQARSAYRNNIYVVWNDLESDCTPPGCGGNTTCNNDIFLGIGVPDDREDPSSWSWTKINLTDALSDDYTDEFYPSLTVDPADGSVYVSYYRSGSGSGGNFTARQQEVHYVLQRSIDGGATWEGPLQVTDLPTDESGNGAFLGMQWGDYTWNDVVDGVAYPAWTDRREGADEDIWAAKVCSEPTHWSERAPTFEPPPTQVVDSGTGPLVVSWAAPDLYWGDGGEDPSRRSYELWVDGTLAIDDIPWTSHSTMWTPPDDAAHLLQIRAVNQCGVSKSYAATPSKVEPCEPSETSMCLGRDDRFELRVTWRDFFGNSGSGKVVPLGALDSGLFWFFAPDNWEMLVKVIDGCGYNEHYWVFAAATTNVEYTLTVTDTQVGSSFSHTNPLGQLSDAITDIQAFATCP